MSKDLAQCKRKFRSQLRLGLHPAEALLKARNFHMASGQWLRPGQSFNFMEATPSAGTALPAPFQTTGHTSVHNNSLHFFLGAASLKPSIQLMAQKSWAKFS